MPYCNHEWTLDDDGKPPSEYVCGKCGARGEQCPTCACGGDASYFCGNCRGQGVQEKLQPKEPTE